MLVYNIVCVADQAYAQHAAVMLTSLFETDREHRFRVFLLTYMMNAETKKRLYHIAGQYEHELHIIEDDYEYAGLEKMKVKTWNTIMYLKLLILNYLPKDAERCLFLDVDMIVNANLRELYEMKLDGCILAGCEDYLYSICHTQKLHLCLEDKYINSGVMVMDLVKWQEKEEKNPVVEFLSKYRDIIGNDQDAIALYFRNEIKYLPYKWNATTFCFQRIPRIFPKYMKQLDEVRHRPCIIHFCEPVKPWFKECKHPYRGLYKKYLRMTPWADYKFPSCKMVDKKPVGYYLLRYWLNYIGVLKDYSFEVPIKKRKA